MPATLIRKKYVHSYHTASVCQCVCGRRHLVQVLPTQISLLSEFLSFFPFSFPLLMLLRPLLLGHDLIVGLHLNRLLRVLLLVVGAAASRGGRGDAVRRLEV